MSIVATFLLVNENANQKYVFDEPGHYIVGREYDCSLVIPPELDASVSRNHCQILVTEMDVYIRDTGSSNGTYINNQQLQDSSSCANSPDTEASDSKINSGDILKVGETIFQVDVKVEQPVETVTVPPVEDINIPVSEVAPEPMPSITPEPIQPPVTSTSQKPLSAPQIPGDNEGKPILVNGWTILPQKKKNKNLIVINNVKI